MSSHYRTVSAPSTKMARQFWGEHHWDNLSRARAVDPYASVIDVPATRLQTPIDPQVDHGPSPVQLLHLIREGSISQVASALLRFTALGGNINGRMHEEHLSPGVEELDTFLHVAFRHRRIDMIKHLIGKGANPNVQNWHLETPAMTAERQNLAYLLPATGADREKSTVWTTDQEIFNKPKMVQPERGVLEACYAWREGAPKTVSPTKAAFKQHKDGSLGPRQLKMPIQPWQREVQASDATAGRPKSRPHNASHSSPASHLRGTSDGTSGHFCHSGMTHETGSNFHGGAAATPLQTGLGGVKPLGGHQWAAQTQRQGPYTAVNAADRVRVSGTVAGGAR